MTINGYEFDRFLRHDESRRGYTPWPRSIPSSSGDLLLATITEIASGEHATKPAH
jgi:hypothetical protein